MIEIIDFNKKLQNDTKLFVINNINKELDIKYKNVFITITKDLDNIYDNYISKGGRFLIAYDNYERKIVGTIAFTFENGIAVLKRFYVLKESRKKKIGFLLYKTLEKVIRLKNIKDIYLSSGKELEYAHKFYKKNGWKKEMNNPGIFVRDGAILYHKEMEDKSMKDYKILKDLVHFNTIYDKENKNIIDYIENYLKNFGFKTEYKTKVLIMSIGKNPKLGFLGHTDTVEYIKKFKNPFDVYECDGYLYGLGVCDMKGGIAAMMEDLITESTNPVMLLDKIYRCQDRFIRSYKYETKVYIDTVTHLLEKRIDGYSYESVVKEVMSLFEC